ncbi:hypothetical protein BXY58_0538 [Epilithonimonas arachidiradicis]|uniref:TonB-like protein n=2 Tax=Epilithonimonas arachidiradicis TaxID=1617282 RepID=A0A420DDH1_9FLAO|nr:hypothetical protein BXY58_0538 [Epilithonimonas arachidiradicis]GGG46577.1 hypothetical protein GCM10007332_05150 [Epilithonimonas arachidiradicis]
MLSFVNLFSQNKVLTEFPKNQLPYIGGYEAYYNDFHNIIAEQNLQPCNNKNELYQFSVLITSDASIKFIKDVNEQYVEKNKCAYNLARQVAQYQKNWNPAIVDGLKENAIARFIIYPDDLFENFRNGYTPVFTAPVFNLSEKDHLGEFQKDLLSKLDLRRFDWNDIFTVETEFIINKEGKMENIILTKPSGLHEFDKMIINSYKSIRKKWKPATINGIPIDYRFKHTLRAVTDPQY